MSFSPKNKTKKIIERPSQMLQTINFKRVNSDNCDFERDFCTKQESFVYSFLSLEIYNISVTIPNFRNYKNYSLTTFL